LGVDGSTTGVVVRKLDNPGPTYPLKEWDILSRIGDYDIDDDGMVQVREHLRLNFHYLIQKLARDGKVRMTVVRDGKERAVDVPVNARHEKLLPDLREHYPSYFIFGPLVFSAVTEDFLVALEKRHGDWLSWLSTTGSPLVTRRSEHPRFPGEQLVAVAAPMFPHPIGEGYDDPFAYVVEEVNGVKIRNLRHLVETLRDSKDRFVSIKYAGDELETMVFDRAEALRATDDILKANNVRQPCSDDLAPVWENKPKG
jgi:hypothetical protein